MMHLVRDTADGLLGGGVSLLILSAVRPLWYGTPCRAARRTLEDRLALGAVFVLGLSGVLMAIGH